MNTTYSYRHDKCGTKDFVEAINETKINKIEAWTTDAILVEQVSEIGDVDNLILIQDFPGDEDEDFEEK